MPPAIANKHLSTSGSSCDADQERRLALDAVHFPVELRAVAHFHF